jgi:hypothetical protein
VAYAFWGTGTTFYGRAMFRADGSHLMTEFVTILYCPLIPLRSLRAVAVGQRTTGVPFIFGSIGTDYSILETGRPDPLQCLRVYALVIGVILGSVFFSLFAAVLVAVAITVLLRYRARRRIS